MKRQRNERIFKYPVFSIAVENNAVHRLMYEIRPYRFRSRICLEQFESEPALFASK